jgi:PhnO protein
MALYNDFVEEDRYSDLDNDSFQAVIAGENNYILVAEADSRLAGFITASIRPVVRYLQPIMQIEELYVDPDFREHGIGRKLIQEVEGIASENNCLRIYVESAYKHKPAHKFYEKNGYKNSGYHFLKIL